MVLLLEPYILATYPYVLRFPATLLVFFQFKKKFFFALRSGSGMYVSGES